MVNSVLTAIGNKILELYPKSTIYCDEVGNGFEAGSFFLYASDVQYEKGLTNYYRGNARLVIKYFPKKGQSNLDVNSMMQTLLRELCLIQAEGKGLVRLSEKSTCPDTEFSQLMCKIAWRDIKLVPKDKFNRVSSIQANTK